MNHREYLKLITETPIAYDDETRAKIGSRDLKTKTVWGKTPPVNANEYEIEEWIKNCQKKGILKQDSYINAGSSRAIDFNDGKTVFKYNIVHGFDFGNQTDTENKIYKKFGSKWQHLLPTIYKSGINWQVVESVDCKFTNAKFKKATGVKWEDWEMFIDEIWVESLTENFIKAKKSAKKALVDLNKKLDDEYYGFLIRISESPALCEMIEMCFDTGINWADFHDQNLGFKNGNLIIVDWGFKPSRPI